MALTERGDQRTAAAAAPGPAAAKQRDAAQSLLPPPKPADQAAQIAELRKLLPPLTPKEEECVDEGLGLGLLCSTSTVCSSTARSLTLQTTAPLPSPRPLTPTSHPNDTPLPRHVQHKLRSAKRAARSELSVTKGEWRRHGYAEGNAALSVEGLVDDLPRVHIAVRFGAGVCLEKMHVGRRQQRVHAAV